MTEDVILQKHMTGAVILSNKTCERNRNSLNKTCDRNCDSTYNTRDMNIDSFQIRHVAGTVILQIRPTEGKLWFISVSRYNHYPAK